MIAMPTSAPITNLLKPESCCAVRHEAIMGLATHLSDAGQHAAALALATRVLVDGASRDTMRISAAKLQQAARDQLAEDEAAQIEAQVDAQPIPTVLAELALPL